MLKALLLAVLMMAGTSHAQSLEDKATNAALGDTASTLGAIALGAGEANPLGLVALGLKPPILAYIKTLPDDERAEAYAIQGSIWGAATANNLCVIAAILTGGAFAPACIAVGAAYGIKTWNESQEEREFWDMCREHRIYANKQLTCTYIRKEHG